MPHHYDETGRRQWQNPEQILETIGLKAGMTFLDIGCGQGFFTLPAAKTVGEKGKVYALDISANNIAVLQQKLSLAGLNNVVPYAQPAENAILCEHSADISFFGIVLHDFQDARQVLLNAFHMLKPTGILANLDWEKESAVYGPPENIRFSREKAANLISETGFEITSIADSGLYHYLILARPAFKQDIKTGTR